MAILRSNCKPECEPERRKTHATAAATWAVVRPAKNHAYAAWQGHRSDVQAAARTPKAVTIQGIRPNLYAFVLKAFCNTDASCSIGVHEEHPLPRC